MKTNILMLYREIIVLCSEKYTKHVNGFCGQNVDCLKAKPSVTATPLLPPNAFIGFQDALIKC